jgi:hypothetical protein
MVTSLEAASLLPVAGVTDVLGISEYLARKHYAKWSSAHQQRIASIMSLVQTGEAPAATLQAREQHPLIQ